MRCLLLLAIVIQLGIPLVAADWPQFRGAHGDGLSPEHGIMNEWLPQPPALLWQVELSDAGYAGPAVADGKVFILDHQGGQDVVRTFDLWTGKELWRYGYPESGDGSFGFARATPAIGEGKVYTLSKTGAVYCLSEANGARIWSRNLVQDCHGKLPVWGLAASPLLDGEKLILCPGGQDAAMVALRKNTGEILWRGGGSDVPGYATPVAATFDGVPQYVAVTASRLIGVDAESGKLLWSFPWPTCFGVNAASPVIIGDAVFITSGYRQGCALVAIAGGVATARWQNADMQAQFSTPILYHGYLYGTSDHPWGSLVCLDSATGEAKWKWPGFEKGAGVGVDGKLILTAGDSGELVLINMTPVGYMERGRCKPLGGRSWTAPVVVDGKLLVRNQKTLACLNLR